LVARVPADFPTIQAAIDSALEAQRILVSEGIYLESLDFHGKNIEVCAVGGRANTVLDGTGLAGSVIRATSGESASAIIQGFTIRNGTSGTLVNGQLVGGGMLIENASPTIRDCAFVSNSVGAGAGGGLAAINSHSIIEQCTFTQNSAGEGGGLWIDGGRPAITGCTITDNVSSGHGGGVFARPVMDQLPNARLLDNTICGNVSADPGRMNVWALFEDGGNMTCDCTGDVDGDGKVDFADLSMPLLFFGMPPDLDFIQPDQDMNGVVDFADAALLLLGFGPCN
jgi:hypothetical protein